MTLPTDPKKIRATIKRLERLLRKEKEKHGEYYGDGSGKRYRIGPLYLLMDDVDGALAAFDWYGLEFPDDIGDPCHFLCWALALYKSGRLDSAANKLHETMLSNVFLLPHLFDFSLERLPLLHGNNEVELIYVREWLEPEFISMWTASEKSWAEEVYNTPEFTMVRERFIEIETQLNHVSVGPARTALVNELFDMKCRLKLVD
jgi:hypothetical protein